jgi:hypothetical protein
MENPKPAEDAQTAGFDLDSVEDLFAAEYELLHPVTEAPTGAFITLAGPEHPGRKKIAMDLMRRLRATAARAKQAMPDPEEDARESVKLLAKVTLGWRGIRKKGVLVAFSEAEAAELYGDPKRQWVVKQLLQAMNDQELFIKA